jgi:hypothetical protein
MSVDVNAHFTAFHVRPFDRTDCRKYSTSSTLRNPPCVLGQYSQTVAANITAATPNKVLRLTFTPANPITGFPPMQSGTMLAVSRARSESGSDGKFGCNPPRRA